MKAKTRYTTLMGVAKAVLRGKFIPANMYIKKKKDLKSVI